MKTKVLSWLLHHANKGTKDEHFYKIKNELLKTHGVHLRYDVQFITGKKCHSCGGTGVHYYYNYRNFNKPDVDSCWYCHNGWHRLPEYNILAVLRFGKYTFHQPYARVYKKPDFVQADGSNLIQGYIEKDGTQYSKFALNVLYFIYDKEIPLSIQEYQE